MQPGDPLRQTVIYLRAQERAWLSGRVVYAVRCHTLDYVAADAFRPTAETTIEYVAFPPGWVYRPPKARAPVRARTRTED